VLTGARVGIDWVVRRISVTKTLILVIVSIGSAVLFKYTYFFILFKFEF